MYTHTFIICIRGRATPKAQTLLPYFFVNEKTLGNSKIIIPNYLSCIIPGKSGALDSLSNISNPDIVGAQFGLLRPLVISRTQGNITLTLIRRNAHKVPWKPKLSDPHRVTGFLWLPVETFGKFIRFCCHTIYLLYFF